MHDELYVLSRRWKGRCDSSSGLIDNSQSVKIATMVAQTVGYDGAEKFKGRKRHLSIDP